MVMDYDGQWLRVDLCDFLSITQVQQCHGPIVCFRFGECVCLVCVCVCVSDKMATCHDVVVAVENDKIVLLVRGARWMCADAFETDSILGGNWTCGWMICKVWTVPCGQWALPVPPSSVGTCGEWCPVQPSWHGLDSILDYSNGCIESRRRKAVMDKER